VRESAVFRASAGSARWPTASWTGRVGPSIRATRGLGTADSRAGNRRLAGWWVRC